MRSSTPCTPRRSCRPTPAPRAPPPSPRPGSAPCRPAPPAAPGGGAGPVFLNTHAAVLLGIVYNYLPLMVFPLYVSLERLDKRLIEASKDLGANRLRTF